MPPKLTPTARLDRAESENARMREAFKHVPHYRDCMLAQCLKCAVVDREVNAAQALEGNLASNLQSQIAPPKGQTGPR